MELPGTFAGMAACGDRARHNASMSAHGPARMDLQWLGPPRLLLDGQPVALPTRKACALLLLLAVGGSVARPRLCAWLWPDLDESSARRNLRRELARLREVGAGAAVRADGDRLLPGPDLTHDLARAEALVCAGEPEAALALWRGDAAEGLVADGGDDMGLAAWLAEQRQHARALHRRARETSAEAAEARGDLATALASVQALLADDALGRCGSSRRAARCWRRSWGWSRHPRRRRWRSRCGRRRRHGPRRRWRNCRRHTRRPRNRPFPPCACRSTCWTRTRPRPTRATCRISR
jgi:hypothetical protein